jgi:hypothetical protein
MRHPSAQGHQLRVLPGFTPRARCGCVGVVARFGLTAGFVLPARSSAMVALVVICSGFMRSSITAGFLIATARRKAGANSAVLLTTLRRGRRTPR